MWYLGNVRIYTQEFGGNNKQIVARLQPFDTGTVLQVFGYENEIKNLNCMVVGDTDLGLLKGMVVSGIAGTTYPLSGYGTVYGNYYVSNLSWKRSPYLYQTIRQDLACDTPVYNVDLELMS